MNKVYRIILKARHRLSRNDMEVNWSEFIERPTDEEVIEATSEYIQMTKNLGIRVKEAFVREVYKL